MFIVLISPCIYCTAFTALLMVIILNIFADMTIQLLCGSVNMGNFGCFLII